MSFADFQKKRGTAVGPGAVVETSAAPVSSADADAELASWWKSNQTSGPSNTASQQRRFRGGDSSGSSSDEDSPKRPSRAQRQPEPVHAKMAPPPEPEAAAAAPSSFAKPRFAAPVAVSTPGAMSMDEIELSLIHI